MSSITVHFCKLGQIAFTAKANHTASVQTVTQAKRDFTENTDSNKKILPSYYEIAHFSFQRHLWFYLCHGGERSDMWNLAPLTLSAELIGFVVHHVFDSAAIGQSGVLIKSFEGLAGAVGLGVELAVLAVSWGASVPALRVPPGGQRAVGSAFFHFHGNLVSCLNIKGRERSQFSPCDSTRRQRREKRPWLLLLLICLHS